MAQTSLTQVRLLKKLIMAIFKTHYYLTNELTNIQNTTIKVEYHKLKNILSTLAEIFLLKTGSYVGMKKHLKKAGFCLFYAIFLNI